MTTTIDAPKRGGPFLDRLAPNGQAWFEYCSPAPPTADGEGRLTGAWCECMSSAVIFEITNPDWESMEGYDDGAAGQVIDFCQKCDYDIGLLNSCEETIKAEMTNAEGDPIAFLRNFAKNGRTWKEYCANIEPSLDENGFVNGAWGECLTAAVIFEHQNLEWSKLSLYSEDGPAGQVIRYFLERGHEVHEENLNRTEAATHDAVQNSKELPVFDKVYQTYTGQEPAPHIDETPPVMTGRKKALLIGCNYPGSSAELGGCINDVGSWHEILTSVYNFNERDVTVFTDDQTDPSKRPTLANIRMGLRWLVAGAVPGDVLFWQFSGHGSQQASKSNNESDGLDEVLCPTDYDSAGMLVDDEIFDLVVRPLESGVKLTIILDCCHSGTAVDLPFTWHDENDWEEVGGTIYTAGDVQMFSGCEDAQTSADVSRHGRRGGAMTMAMTDAIKEDPGRTYPDLLNRLREILEERGMEQYPRLTSSQKFDPRSKCFDLTQGAIPNMNPVLGSTGPPRHFPARVNAGGGDDEGCVVM
eukprot:TRINITY_DN67518_c0_g1_i1.p1 TRINITY_DN67518_c0_g1~~TRINITY_DN67518_c0_g1_i1.p1  ORF type:complete len:563 (-),score=74.67 TRINITY_DN67518_c0_g1_i1:43-1623(-)